jgi:hypothetical protein
MWQKRPKGLSLTFGDKSADFTIGDDACDICVTLNLSTSILALFFPKSITLI